jgi:hypothetical protein
MTTLLTLTKESKCVISEDVKVICAHLSGGESTFLMIHHKKMSEYDVLLTTLIVNDKEMTDYWIYKDKITYKVPLVLHKGDILELSSDVTANIVIEKIV